MSCKYVFFMSLIYISVLYSQQKRDPFNFPSDVKEKVRIKKSETKDEIKKTGWRIVKRDGSTIVLQDEDGNTKTIHGVNDY